MASSKISEMQQAIKSYIRRNLPKDKNNAVKGQLQGSRVIINNKSYPYEITIEERIEVGDTVVCLLPDSGNVAAIVGRA